MRAIKYKMEAINVDEISDIHAGIYITLKNGKVVKFECQDPNEFIDKHKRIMDFLSSDKPELKLQ